MPKKSPPKTRPDVRTGGPNDPSSWTPARTYDHLCALKRRPQGHLSLSEMEFTAARAEYVTRALGAWLRRWMALPATSPRRSYIRDTRESVFDDPRLGKDWRFRERRFRAELAAAEFAYIILWGESRALKTALRSWDRAWATVRARYAHLPQVHRDGMADLVGRTPPTALACEEIGEKYHCTPSAIPVLLSPSQRRRAGLPSELARLFKALSEEPTKQASR